jgi:hypothetical protein
MLDRELIGMVATVTVVALIATLILLYILMRFRITKAVAGHAPLAFRGPGLVFAAALPVIGGATTPVWFRDMDLVWLMLGGAIWALLAMAFGAYAATRISPQWKRGRMEA